MGYFDNRTGITIASGFKLQAEKPIDPRFVATTLDEAKLIVSENGGYNGLRVYVESEKAFYVCTDIANNVWALDYNLSVSYDSEAQAIVFETGT